MSSATTDPFTELARHCALLRVTQETHGRELLYWVFGRHEFNLFAEAHSGQWDKSTMETLEGIPIKWLNIHRARGIISVKKKEG